ncbi:MAG TPA: hypothetical protein VIM51_05435 [Desulfosporosinus sp.]
MYFNAKILATAMLAMLPAEKNIESEFQIVSKNGKIISYTNESFLHVVRESKAEEFVPNIAAQEKLAELMQKAQDHTGFAGKILVKFVGKNIFSISASRTMGMERLYCSLCESAQNDCVECNPVLAECWSFCS